MSGGLLQLPMRASGRQIIVYVFIKDALWFRGQGEIVLTKEADKCSNYNLISMIRTAFAHVNDLPLVEANCGGTGPMADLGEISCEE